MCRGSIKNGHSMRPFTEYVYVDHLASERLLTQFLTEEDTFPWAHFFDDPEATRFLGIASLNLPDHLSVSRHMIHKQLARYQSNQFGLQKLVLKETGSFIGLCGLLLQNVDGVLEIEIGYHLFSAYWGKGYATEAASLFESFAFQQLNCPSVISVIDKENDRSRKVAIRNQFDIEKETIWFDNQRVFIYRKLNPIHL